MGELDMKLQGIQFSQTRLGPQNPQYFTSHQSSTAWGKPCNRVKFNWKKLKIFYKGTVPDRAYKQV